jgi:high frequency lysogenization protein
MKERTMALAGIFQATELVRQAANHGTWSGYAADTCLHSLLAIEADSVDDIYGSTDRLRLGAETLIAALQGDRRYIESLGYAVSIMQLEANFRKNAKMQSYIGTEIMDIVNFDDGTEAHEIKDMQAKKIAELYTQTVSTLSPRIVINGRPQYLQVDRTVSWIRTLLFSGLRSAVLWRQMGGKRRQLLFNRKKLIHTADDFLLGR